MKVGKFVMPSCLVYVKIIVIRVLVRISIIIVQNNIILTQSHITIDEP